MAEEFDIMKPISAELDIGTTMFDKPKAADAAEAACAPPEDDGVYNADFGYLTAEEAALVSDISDAPEAVGIKAGAAVCGPVSAAPSDISPLDRALAELEEELSGAAASDAGSSAVGSAAHQSVQQMYTVEQPQRDMSVGRLSEQPTEAKHGGAAAMALIIFCVALVTIISIGVMIAAISS